MSHLIDLAYIAALWIGTPIFVNRAYHYLPEDIGAASPVPADDSASNPHNKREKTR